MANIITVHIGEACLGDNLIRALQNNASWSINDVTDWPLIAGLPLVTVSGLKS